MARIARIILSRRPHLIRQEAAWSAFAVAEDCAAYLRILRETAGRYGVKLLAWSLLPCEVHLVAAPPSAGALGSLMRITQSRYTRHLHAKGHAGPVTMRRYASCALGTSCVPEAVKFVESRPVAAGLSRTVLRYAYTSAAARGKGGDGLSDWPGLGEKIVSWSKWHSVRLSAQREAFLALRLRTGKPIGDEAFVRRLERRTGMSLSRGRGRPRVLRTRES